MIQKIDEAVSHIRSRTALKPRVQAVAVRLETLFSDPQFVGKAARDGY